MNTAAATQPENVTTAIQGNLFLQSPETDLHGFLVETARFASLHTEIIEQIDEHLDSAALKKKRLRIADRKFLESPAGWLAGLQTAGRRPDAGALVLETGRPRMPARLVFMFLMLRGFLGNLTSAASRRMLAESTSLQVMAANHGLESMPAPNTILAHLNNLPPSVHESILDAQIADFLDEELDEFSHLTQDSTSVFANSEWPTDGKVIIGLAARTLRTGKIFGKLGFAPFRQWHVPGWIEQMERLEYEICLSAGKPGSRRRMKRAYKKIHAKARKAAGRLEAELKHCVAGMERKAVAPSRRRTLRLAIKQMRRDIADIRKVAGYSEKRVMHGESLPAKEKILSLSDGSAAYIKKGGRQAVIGYKPQICRSAEGFIVNLEVPEGNASDSERFKPVVEKAVRRTGVAPVSLSVDDGYSSKKNREHFAGDIPVVSMGGAKGKKITPPEEWDSPEHKEARRMRSAIESMMYTIKHNFEFGRLGRRGIEAVRCELSEKAIAYNFCRAMLIRKRLAAERASTAA